jgi:excisionase family DNA binding protein
MNETKASGGPYSVQDVAAALDKSERTVRNWIADGDLGATKTGRSYTITRSDLVAYLGNEQRVDDLFGGGMDSE